jgi:hypothetical protein
MQALIRESLIGLVRNDYIAAYPTIPIVFDNAPFDRNNPPAQWVEYEIKFSGGSQIALAALPKTRIHGFLYVTVWVREGTGSKTALTMLDWFAARLQYRAANRVQLQAAEPVPDSSPSGWYCEQLKLYFYSDPA